MNISCGQPHLEDHLEVFPALCAEDLHVQEQVEAVVHVARVLVFDQHRGGQRAATGPRGAQSVGLAMCAVGEREREEKLSSRNVY